MIATSPQRRKAQAQTAKLSILTGALFFISVGVVASQAAGFEASAATSQDTQHRREIASAKWKQHTLALVSPQDFLKLSEAQQKLVLATYREVVFELEAVQPKADSTESRALNQWFAAFERAFAEASAQDNSAADQTATYNCFFGGWPSTLVNGKCTRPSAANNALYKGLATASNCGADSFTCFPGIFGQGACFKLAGENGHSFPAGTLAGCGSKSKGTDEVLAAVKANPAIMGAALNAGNAVLTQACGPSGKTTKYICDSMRQKLTALQKDIGKAPPVASAPPPKPEQKPAKPAAPPKPSQAPLPPGAPAPKPGEAPVPAPAPQQQPDASKDKALACYLAVTATPVAQMPDNRKTASGDGKAIAWGQCAMTVVTTPAATAGAAPTNSAPENWCRGVPATMATAPGEMDVTKPDPKDSTKTVTVKMYGTIVHQEGKDYFYPVGNSPAPTDWANKAPLQFADLTSSEIDSRLKTAKDHPVDAAVAAGFMDTYTAGRVHESVGPLMVCSDLKGAGLAPCKAMLTACQASGETKTVAEAKHILALPALKSAPVPVNPSETTSGGGAAPAGP